MSARKMLEPDGGSSIKPTYSAGMRLNSGRGSLWSRHGAVITDMDGQML